MKILTLGDSINFGYRADLIKFTEGIFEISTKEGLEDAARNLNIPVGANCGDSRMLLTYLKDEFEHGRLKGYDLISLNCGLHDIKFDTNTNKIQIEAEEYERNLREIVNVLNENGVSFVFVNSTPVHDEIHNSPENIKINFGITRTSENLNKYNNIAKNVMEESDIPLIDLYSITKSFGTIAVRDHVHYYPEYCRIQAAFIAGALCSHVK